MPTTYIVGQLGGFGLHLLYHVMFTLLLLRTAGCWL